jgi:hypothetical protein
MPSESRVDATVTVHRIIGEVLIERRSFSTNFPSDLNLNTDIRYVDRTMILVRFTLKFNSAFSIFP